jgi:leucyl-tRNA synthetase
MAYYTISHHLQSDMEGKQAGLMGIPVEDLDDAAFSFIFLGEECEHPKIPKEKLEKLRAEFNYWYPMDLRCSGKDLIKNHLTMALFNHQAVF